MEFRILGSLEIASDQALLEVRGAQRRAVLGLLLVHANHAVSADELIDALWAGRPPRSASTTLQTYVYQLRKTLALDCLRTRPSGYVLELQTHELDALDFERAVAEVAQAPSASPEWIAPRLRSALGRWRGRALADFDGMAWAQPEAARLESLRVGAAEELIDARLALGEHASLVSELESLVVLHPFRERLWAQLMLALYRSDRQAEALRAYGRLRRTLGDELGIEPNPEVSRLETAMLRQDPALDLHRPAAAPRRSPTEAVPAGHRVRRRPSRRAVAIATVLAVAAATLGSVKFLDSSDTASAVPPPSGYRPRFHTTACPPAIRSGSSTVRCGQLVVPEDRSHPARRTVSLGVYRYPAQVPHPAADPVVQVQRDFRLTEPPDDTILRTRSDSIYLSGRGFFGSEPRLTCPELSDAVKRSLARPLRGTESEVEFLGAAQSCRSAWQAKGVHLQEYSAAEVAVDVRDLAYVLKVPQVNLVAGADSTLDAREISGRYPGLVRSILLMNVTPPDANRWNGAITNAAGALSRYVAECAAQAACVTRYPDLAGELRAVYTRAASAPVDYGTPDPTDPTRSLTVRLDGDRAMQSALLALNDRDGLPLVAAALANPGSGQAAVDFSVSYTVLPADASWGALLSGICVDEIGTVGREGLSVEAGASPQLAFLAADPLLDVCPIWGTRDAPSRAPGPTDVPTLILQGALDPFTSPEWAAATARSFGGATVLQLAHLGNVALSGDACVVDLRLRFLDSPRAHIDRRSCRNQTAPVHFSGT